MVARATRKGSIRLGELTVGDEMLDLARHIIRTKSGSFSPRGFDDRYDQALAERVRAKITGRRSAAPKPYKETKVTTLMDALRKSAKLSGKTKPAHRGKTGALASRARGSAAAPRQRKAG